MKSLLAFLALVTPTFAGHCCSYAPTRYVQPTVVVQQVLPYAYWSVGAAIQEQAVAQRVALLVKQDLGGYVAASQMPATVVAPQARAAAAVASAHPQALTKPHGLEVLEQNCTKCHKPGSKSIVEEGAPALFDAAGNLTATSEQVGSILTITRLGAMPPAPADPLSEEDFAAVKSYLKGTPAPQRPAAPKAAPAPAPAAEAAPDPEQQTPPEPKPPANGAETPAPPSAKAPAKNGYR